MISSSTYVLKIYMVEFKKNLFKHAINQMICSSSSSFTTRILNYIFIFVILYVNCYFVFFQMLDMIMPKKLNVISLQDLKRCRMTPIFFDTFFNLEKYLDHEQRDPFASQRDVDEDGNEVRKKNHFKHEVSNW